METVIPQWSGYMCVVIAGFCFGSNFVPVKWYERQVGDGMFFQWIFCSAVWMAGFIVYASRGFPDFQPLAMLGGFLWCTGNIMTVPIIKCIGLSLGMLLWALSNLLMGWCSGTFGLFGLTPEKVEIPWVNYVGAFMACISGALFAFIETTPTPTEVTNYHPLTEDELIVDRSTSSNTSVNSKGINDEVAVLLNPDKQTEPDFIDRMHPVQKRITGIIMAIVAGIFYGVNFDPPQYLIDNCEECSKVGLDYVFSHFCGIFTTSTFYFLVYCIFKKNNPIVPVEVAFPGFLSGLMWALADVCWFVANSSLALVITFPTISVLPCLVASLWGILAFGEIRGQRNFIIFGVGFFFTAVSITCTVISQSGA